MGSYTELPLVDPDALAEEVASGQWIMVVMCADPEEQEILDELLPDDDENYDWYRLDAGTPDARKLIDKYDLEATTQFVIFSLYRGRPKTWVLDDLEGRDPEDIAQFMDDHASDVESGE